MVEVGPVHDNGWRIYSVTMAFCMEKWDLSVVRSEGWHDSLVVLGSFVRL